jgi:hypothetical protein
MMVYSGMNRPAYETIKKEGVRPLTKEAILKYLKERNVRPERMKIIGDTIDFNLDMFSSAQTMDTTKSWTNPTKNPKKPVVFVTTNKGIAVNYAGKPPMSIKEALYAGVGQLRPEDTEPVIAKYVMKRPFTKQDSTDVFGAEGSDLKLVGELNIPRWDAKRREQGTRTMGGRFLRGEKFYREQVDKEMEKRATGFRDVMNKDLLTRTNSTRPNFWYGDKERSSKTFKEFKRQQQDEKRKELTQLRSHLALIRSGSLVPQSRWDVAEAKDQFEFESIKSPNKERHTKRADLFWMTPQTFLKEVRREQFFMNPQQRTHKPYTAKSQQEEFSIPYSQKNIAMLKETLQKPETKMEVPFLTYKMIRGKLHPTGHEGRHRAFATIAAGGREMPVMVRQEKTERTKHENAPAEALTFRPGFMLDRDPHADFVFRNEFVKEKLKPAWERVGITTYEPTPTPDHPAHWRVPNEQRPSTPFTPLPKPNLTPTQQAQVKSDWKKLGIEEYD